MKQSRFQASRPLDNIKAKIVDLTIGHREGGSVRTFYLAQVIDSNDPKNANRIKVRIPLLDDPFYLKDNGDLSEDSGHDLLPYCIPAHGRMIDTPENGSVVLIALLDPQQPHFGRAWFSAVPELSSKDIFDVSRSSEESTTGVWDNAQASLNTRYNNSPDQPGRPIFKSKDKTKKDKVGLRGKGKNKLLFEEEKTTIIQNEKVNKKESKIELTEDMKLTSQKFEILSSNSNQKLHPMFGDPNYTFQQSLLNVMNQIVTLLSTSPGLYVLLPPTPIPVLPSPVAASIVASFQKLNVDFQKLKLEGQGQSKNLLIN
jgi:hypothetical protein